MESPNNVVAFRPYSDESSSSDTDDDLRLTGAHMIESLRDEFEKEGMLTQGLSFSFNMLLYGLTKDVSD